MMNTTITQLRIALLCILAGVTTTTLANSDTPEPNPSGQPAFAHQANDDSLSWGPCPAFMPESCRIAVLQGDPGQPNADLFFRMAPDTTIPRHWHHSPERMVLVQGEMHVEYDGQEPTVLRPGTYAYGPAEKPHSAYCAEGDTCVLFIGFEKPVDAFEY